MGAIQILVRENPLSVPGLSTIQAMLFWEATAQHLLAFGTIFVSIVPIPFAFTGYSPVVCPQLWEFTAVFGVFYLSNRIMVSGSCLWHESWLHIQGPRGLSSSSGPDTTCLMTSTCGGST